MAYDSLYRCLQLGMDRTEPTLLPFGIRDLRMSPVGRPDHVDELVPSYSRPHAGIIGDFVC